MTTNLVIASPAIIVFRTIDKNLPELLLSSYMMLIFSNYTHCYPIEQGHG